MIKDERTDPESHLTDNAGELADQNEQEQFKSFASRSDREENDGASEDDAAAEEEKSYAEEPGADMTAGADTPQKAGIAATPGMDSEERSITDASSETDNDEKSVTDAASVTDNEGKPTTDTTAITDSDGEAITHVAGADDGEEPKTPPVVEPEAPSRGDPGLPEHAEIPLSLPQEMPAPEKNMPSRPERSADEDCANAFNWNFADSTKKANEKERKKRRTGAWVYAAIMGATFLVSFVILAAVLMSDTVNNSGSKTTDGAQSQRQSELKADSDKVIYVREYDPSSGALTPQEIYAKCSPAVVSVHSSSSSLEGVGSGFLISTDGYIATAAHIVENMENVEIITCDGASFEASVIGADGLTDVALLKIEASNMPCVDFGSSGSVVIGDELVTIGTPASLDYAGTLTRGDVSYCDRIVYIYDKTSGLLEKKMKLIQTSVIVNPGNSGGPVFDIYGNVVGIVTMKLGDNYSGIGFVIPSDAASGIIDDMKSGTEITDAKRALVAVRAPKLGIKGESFASDDLYGVRVTGFISDEYDAALKLRKGDIVVKIGADSVTGMSGLGKIINKYDPGESVDVTVYRSGQYLTYGVTLGQ